MQRPITLMLAAVILLASGGCSDSDDPIVAPPADLYVAHGTFANFLVADGFTDTRMNVRLGSDLVVASNVQPNQSTLDRDLLLAASQQTSSLGIYLTTGGGVLNDGELFPLTQDRSYLFMAMGHVDSVQGALKPTLLQLDPLASPGVTKVQFRFVHALAGSPGPVDVYVNGEVITNISYGAASAGVTFDARSVGKDSVFVVPTGVTPDGSNELWKSTGHLLFLGDSHYEGILAHHPRSAFDGDISGQTAMILVRDLSF